MYKYIVLIYVCLLFWSVLEIFDMTTFSQSAYSDAVDSVEYHHFWRL